jgi:hypothetical protein
VIVFDGDAPVALGTVVDAAGLVLTVTSEVSTAPQCRLPDGRTVAAEAVAVEPAFDLLLLKVPVSGLAPVKWSDELSPPAGTLLVAPGCGGYPLANGIISVPRRNLPGPHPANLARSSAVVRRPAAPPAIIGSAVQGRGYWVEFVMGEAEAAGVRPGDVIVSIAGATIRSHEDLALCVRNLKGGDLAEVQLLREARPIGLMLILRSDGSPSGMYSGRKSGFPTVFEHDLPLAADQCGGPLIGLEAGQSASPWRALARTAAWQSLPIASVVCCLS